MQHDCYEHSISGMQQLAAPRQASAEDESHLLRNLATPVCRLSQDAVEVAEQVLFREEVKEARVMLVAPDHQLRQRA